MNEIVVTEVQIAPIRSQNGLVAFASCAVNNAFYVGEIAIYTSPNHPLGYRLVFPTKKLGNGKQVPFYYPFRRDIEEMVTKVIVTKYVELMDNFNHIG